MISAFKATSSFYVKNTNTNPPALSAHAVNSLSHVKRGFISPALIYLLIYYKATLFKGNMYVFTEDRLVATELGYMEFSPHQVENLPFSLWMGKLKEEMQNHPLSQGAGWGGGELANLWK